ncbi:MAG: alpha/beta hydrolase [Nitrosomonadales bacterium]|nr:alpha/beta hydrolase [Nitrosomonadales bacterium]
MTEYTLYYATNRNHICDDAHPDRFHPKAYGTKFSEDHPENLRFGIIKMTADESEIAKHLSADMQNCGRGDGAALGNYLAKCAVDAQICAYPETLTSDIADTMQLKAKFGSQAMFADLKADMDNNSDVLIYIHGFNVSWFDAVGSALALQLMLHNAPKKDTTQNVLVILFTWPSDGMALPWISYSSDRLEANSSGGAVGRAFLKARDFLADLRDRSKKGGAELCGQDIHLLCHSMGNYLLQSALARTFDHTPGSCLPRLFEHVFLCAADVDDNALEAGQPLERIDQISRNVTIYYNRNDKAMWVSDYTKGNPERLGHTGAAHPALLHNKVHQVDCTPVVHDLIQHSYYLGGSINADIRASMDGWEQADTRRLRAPSATQGNIWTMK